MIRGKNIVIISISSLLLIFSSLKISKSNSSYTYYTQTESVDNGDIIAINKLTELVDKNFLDREYYEAAAYTDINVRWYANYNKKYNALLISGDPASGWSYFFYATPEELKIISNKKIKASKINLFLKPFPPEILNECPTRSRNIFSIF